MKFFNKPNQSIKLKSSLFAEGMRQILGAGIAYSIIMLVYKVGIVLSEYVAYYYESAHILYSVDFSYLAESELCFSIVLSVVYAGFASILIMRFLNSSSARDFYGSTPNSVGTVWFNFTLSILACMIIGILASGLVQGVVIAVIEASYLSKFLACLLYEISAVVLIVGIWALAYAVTGRLLSGLVTGAGLTFLPAAIYRLLSVSDLWGTRKFVDFVTVLVNQISYGTVNYYYIGHNEYADTDALLTAGPVLYNLLLGLCCLAIGALFAYRRTGDAVSKPFMNNWARALSLTATSFSLMSFFLDIPDFQALITETSNFIDAYSSSAYSRSEWITTILAYALVFLIFFVIIYLLLSLLLEFSFKRMLLDSRFMPISIAVLVAVSGVGIAMTNTTPAEIVADDVESVSFEPLYDYSEAYYDVSYSDLIATPYGTGYAYAVSSEYEFTDEDLIKYVAKYANESSTNNLDSLIIKLNFKMNDGSTESRYVEASSAFVAFVSEVIADDDEALEAIYSLPDVDEANVWLNVSGLSDEDVVEVYKTFVDEYMSMSVYDRTEGIHIVDDYDDDAYYYYYDDDTYYISYYEFDEDTGRYGYYDENGNYCVVSDSDVDKSVLVLPYLDEDSKYFVQGESGTDFGGVSLGIDGYYTEKSGELYNQNYYYYNYFTITYSNFPKTMEKIAELCNQNSIEKFLSYSSYSSIDIYYRSDNLEMSMYLYKSSLKYVSGMSDAELLDYYYGIYEDVDYYNQYYTIVQMDGDELLERICDAADASAEIDFSKPYYMITASSPSGKNEMTVFIQADDFIATLLETNTVTVS